jgi:hypothetical protein
MLSWSSQQSKTEIDLGAVARGRGDVGVLYSDELLQFATAAARLDEDVADIDEARRVLVSVGGQELMIDAAAVAANFHMMTRLADGTGARLSEVRLDAAASAIEVMGIAEMVSRR